MRFAALTVLLAACATATPIATPKGGPRGLRASDHLELANQDDARAHDRTTWPAAPVVGYEARDQPVGMPWYRSWDTAAEHDRMAMIHRGKAAELEAAYQEACGDKPSEVVAISPLVRYGVDGWPTQSGAIIYLSPTAGTPDSLLAALKCHRAFMMLAPADMEACPLDLPGLEVDVRGDAEGITVALSVKDPALISELQHRVAHELEAAQHQGR